MADTYENETPQRRVNVGIIIFFVILVLVVIIIIVLALVQVPYTVSESYTDKVPSEEHYTESVPYNDQDCNQVNMIYKITWVGNGQTQNCLQQQCASYNQICTSYNWLGNCVSYTPQCASYSCVKYNNHCALNIENKESQPLNIQIQVQKYNRDTKSSINVEGYTPNYYVSSLDSTQITWDFTSLPTESMGCIYNTISIPTKQICNTIIRYRDEDRTRTIYTDATKYRDVIKYCPLLKKIGGSCK